MAKKSPRSVPCKSWGPTRQATWDQSTCNRACIPGFVTNAHTQMNALTPIVVLTESVSRETNRQRDREAARETDRQTDRRRRTSKLGKHARHTYLGSQNQAMINEPFRIAIKQSGRRMNVDGLSFHKRLVAFLWVFLGRVDEVAAGERFLNALPILACVATRRKWEPHRTKHESNTQRYSGGGTQK